jgi:cytochrome P450
MSQSPVVAGTISREWCTNHFDFTAPALSAHLHDALGYMREHCPITRTDQHGGQWLVTRYDDVLRIAQDWRTFSNEAKGDGNHAAPPILMLPESVDPPLHTVYKRLINAYFTAAAVARYEDATRMQAKRLIDGFIENGECDFMAQFARPFPGLVFFEEVLHAPADRVAELNEMATAVSTPGSPNAAEGWQGMVGWIADLVEQRRSDGPRGDVVDGVMAAEIEGRPITREETLGIIQLLILGGLETTAGSLGQFMIRFAREPEIPATLRSRLELIPQAVEELLRLDAPFVSIMRRVTTDTEVDGHAIKAGEQVVIWFASANRDEAEFPDAEEFILERKSNRHLAFGAGPHRCAGSHLARMNLRIALEELLPRMHDIALRPGPIEFHNAFNRAPLTCPITFTAVRA